MTMGIAGFVLGCAGSAHCAAMCGPLMLLFGTHAGPSGRMARHVAYHAARLLTYICIGLMAATLGEIAFVGGIGRGVAVVVGIVLMISAVLTLQGVPFAGLAQCANALTRALVRLSGPTTGARRNGTILGSSLMGAINGLLPCGLVYAAAASSASAGWTTSVIVMGSFGLGTLPVLILLALTECRLPSAARKILQRFSPVALAAVGLLVVLRATMADAAPAWHHHGYLR